MKIDRHSPSSLNLWCAEPAMYVLERVIGQRQPVGVAAHRGTAVEDGVAFGLTNRDADPQEAIDKALARYDVLAAMTGEDQERIEKCRKGIPAMVLRGITDLRPYGKPSAMQGFVEWRPDEIRLPIVGYFDFAWDDHGIIVDLKTTERMPGEIRTGHARQVALYAQSDNFDARLTYVTPIKSATYQLENIRAHRKALLQIAKSVEKFLSISDDPMVLKDYVCPDLDSFYWNTPAARQAAFEVWGI